MIYKEPGMLEVRNFVIESNHIEGIAVKRPEKLGTVWYEKISEETQQTQIELLNKFVRHSRIFLGDLEVFVHKNQPENMMKPKLRNIVGMDVYVGDYTPPSGGPEIEQHLVDILELEDTNIAKGRLW